MAITTEDGIVSGLKRPLTLMKNTFTGEAAGHWHDLGLVAGAPGARVFATPGLAGATVDDSSAIGGMLPFENPASGSAYLARLAVSVGANIVGIMFYDLLWYNSGLVVTTTAAQTVNSVAFQSRCIAADDTFDANGGDIMVGLLAAAATTNAGAIANTSYGYTSQNGTAGRSANLVQSFPATAVAGTFVPFGWQASDSGVRSVQSITLGTSYVTGTLNAMAIRKLSFVPFVGATSGALLDWAQLGLPKLANDSAIYAMVLLSGTAAGVSVGELNHAHG
jgi:hypothetical protein